MAERERTTAAMANESARGAAGGVDHHPTRRGRTTAGVAAKSMVASLAACAATSLWTVAGCSSGDGAGRSGGGDAAANQPGGQADGDAPPAPMPADGLSRSTLPTVTPSDPELRREADASLARVMLALNIDDEQTLVEQGLRVARRMECLDCHSTTGSPGAAGPGWGGVWAEMRPRPNEPALLVDASFIRQSIFEPGAYVREGFTRRMPSYRGRLTPREIAAIAAFIRSLDEPEPPALQLNAVASGAGERRGAETEPRDPLNIFNEPTADERRRAEFERMREAPSPPEEAGIRTDGRPAWWFDGLRRQDGRVLLCVETPGDDLASTRRRAVDRAYAALADELDLDDPAALEGPRVELSAVLPLPNPGGARRYTGYVLISAQP